VGEGCFSFAKSVKLGNLTGPGKDEWALPLELDGLEAELAAD
jgi:hypothetical protein